MPAIDVTDATFEAEVIERSAHRTQVLLEATSGFADACHLCKRFTQGARVVHDSRTSAAVDV